MLTEKERAKASNQCNLWMRGVRRRIQIVGLLVDPLFTDDSSHAADFLRGNKEFVGESSEQTVTVLLSNTQHKQTSNPAGQI